MLFLCLLFPQSAQAHLTGQPPFFKMNGKFSDLYPIQTNSYFEDYVLPQDIAPDPYLVNQEILFQIDTKEFSKVVPQPIIDKTTFQWDFGDGTTGTELKNTHAYKKMGSYILSIQAAYSDKGIQVPPQVIQSVLLHVLPDKNYKLPHVVIKVNGRFENKDKLNDVFDVNFTQPIHLDASETQPGTGKIVSYFWDFDDGTSSKDIQSTHSYGKGRQYAGPSLRVKDENGFMVDDFVGMKHNGKINNAIQQTASLSQIAMAPSIAMGVLAVVCMGVGAWVLKRAKR